jgi:apolipoprotein N-acyltransferase
MKSWLPLFLPAISGLLLAASFPRASHGDLAWVAFVPLIAFVYFTNSLARAFWGGFVAGAIQLFVLLIWIPSVLENYGGLHGVLVWIAYGMMVSLLACFPGAAGLGMKLLLKRGGDIFLFLFPIIWVAIEYAQTFVPFGGFPWLLAGYSQTNHPHLIQIADVTGVYGVSFLLLWSGVAVFWAGLHRNHFRVGAWPLTAAVILIGSCLFYGNISIRKWGKIKPDLRVAMLQGNISYDDPDDVLNEKFKHGYVRMADRLPPSGVDLLLIPESPSPVTFQYDSGYRENFERLARRFPLGLVFNNIRDLDSEAGAQFFNSAYFLNRDGSLAGVYDKMHLVPFGEYIPLRDFLPFQTISKDVSTFSRGSDYRLVKIGGQEANAIICYEVVFPDLVRRFVRKGSRLIVNLTNDRWYGDSAAPYQHLAIARWRAIENRRYLLRAANSGISAVIDPAGRIQGATGILREAVCEGRFAFVDQQSFYSRYGDVFAFLCAIIACGFLVPAFVPGVWNRFYKGLGGLLNARRTS